MLPLRTIKPNRLTLILNLNRERLIRSPLLRSMKPRPETVVCGLARSIKSRLGHGMVLRPELEGYGVAERGVDDVGGEGEFCGGLAADADGVVGCEGGGRKSRDGEES